MTISATAASETTLTVDTETNIRDLITRFPYTARIFAAHGLPCAGCHLARYETIAQGAAAHGLAVEPLIADLNRAINEGPEGQASSTSADHTPTIQAENHIQHIIAVASGKGGVGKSSVTALLAVGLRRRGFRVGILDADLTGPSIPKMFGLNHRGLLTEEAIRPAQSSLGIAIVSVNLFLEHEDEPVIWRGPLISSAIKQFYSQTAWGKLDYLLIDLPPGTSDAPLTVLQSLPVEGIIIVSSPQALATMVVRKSVGLAQRLDIPILGVVENMSYIVCPESGKPFELFGPSQGKELAILARAAFLGKLPLDPQLAEDCDHGQIEGYQSEAYAALVQSFVAKIITKRR
ncbi:MAG: P-loop NTPase [Chloroflexi bacterium]|nr:P-loop NTPase [Chloroflexota bacterium]MCL5074127.1 P-loop NTPase [Chloroflexota bacterium]